MSDVCPARLQAIEHVAWCLKEGITLAELHAALGPEAGPTFRCWEDAISRLTRIASDINFYLDEQRERHHRKRDLPPAYRRREPPPGGAWRVCLCDNLCRQDQLPPNRYCKFASRPTRRVA